MVACAARPPQRERCGASQMRRVLDQPEHGRRIGGEGLFRAELEDGFNSVKHTERVFWPARDFLLP